MNPELAKDLLSWLEEPDHAATQREPLSLNPDQRTYATTRTPTGYRRIKGPAGSGKSVVLAARAAKLAMEGLDVLVVSFNITILHYLRDLAVRYPDPGNRSVNRITWLHFHGWCKRVCFEAGMGEEHNLLLAGSDDFPEAELLSLVSRAIAEPGGDVSQYDAVLVDEGQELHFGLVEYASKGKSARRRDGSRRGSNAGYLWSDNSVDRRKDGWCRISRRRLGQT